MKVYDVLLDANNDLIFENGDLKVGESKYQHIRLIVISEKGWWKYAPTLGGHIRDALSDDGSLLEIQGNIQETLEDDGLIIKSLKDIGGKFLVDGEYES